MKSVLYLALACSLFASCMSVNKAKGVLDKHPEDAAQYCATRYPATPSIDSTEYKKSRDSIESLVDEIEAARRKRDESQAEREELISTIERLAATRPDCDSVVDPFRQQLNAERKRATEAERRAQRLAEEARNVKPVTEVIVDRAREKVLENEVRACTDRSLALERERDEWKKKYQDEVKRNKGKLVIRIPWWLLIAAAGVGALIWRWKAVAGILGGLFRKT